MPLAFTNVWLKLCLPSIMQKHLVMEEHVVNSVLTKHYASTTHKKQNVIWLSFIVIIV